jgi:hypothetical protein
LWKKEKVEMAQTGKSKICKNCKQNRPSHAFYQSKRSRDGLTSYCRKCGSISGDKSRYSEDLLNELYNFEENSGKLAPSVRREIDKFDTEFRSGHWEPSILCLGRVCEAHVFELARRLGVSIDFPTIAYLEQLKQTQDKMSENVQELLAGLTPFKHQQNKIRKDAKKLIDNTLSFSFELESLVDSTPGQSTTMDSSFAVKGIKKYFLRNGTKLQIELFKDEFEPLYRQVMINRNRAAHAPRGQSITLLKKDIKTLQPKVVKIISTSSELMRS